MAENTINQKSIANRLLHIGIAILILVIFYFLPVNKEALTIQGKMALGLLVMAVYLWVTEPIPMGVTALAAMILMPVFGVLNYSEVWASWISSVIFFVLAAFALTKAMVKSKLPAKIVLSLIKVSKGKSSLIVLSFMISSTLVSTVISNIPVTAIFAALAMSTILEAEKAVPGKSNLGRCLMIGIVFGSMLGGMCTPVGNAMNIMVMGMLTKNTGITIAFLQWMCMAIPIVVITLPISWFVLIRLYKPEAIQESTKAALEQKAKDLGPLDAFDKKVIAVFCLLVVCWIVSNWTGWDATAICVMGMIIMFLPGVDILTWEEFVNSVAWNITIVIGGVSSLATGVNSKGAGAWLISTTVTAVALTATGLMVGVAAFMPIIRLIVPVAPALIALVTVPFLGLAVKIGASAVLVAMIIAIEINTFLLALDSNTLMSFRYGYFSILQYFFAGLIPTIVICGLCTTLLPVLVRAVGL